MDRLSESIWHGAQFMDFGMCKNGWSGPEYNNLDREQHGVDIKPGGTWGSIHQNRNLSRRLMIVITVCDHHDITVTDYIRDTRAGYKLKKEGCKISNLLFMDDLKLYGKNSTL